MARSFGSTDVVTNSSFGAMAQSGTISVWFKPNWSSGSDALIHYLWATSGDTPSFQRFSDHNIYCGFSSGVGRIVIADTGLFTSGTWANWVFTWSTSGQALYKDAVSKGTTGATTITAGTKWSVGNAGIFNQNANASIAEFVYWSGVILSAGEIGALAAGVDAKRIRPASIGLYVPLWGLSSPEPELGGGAFNGTVTGTSAANHPPVTLWTPKRQLWSPNMSSGSSFIPAWMVGSNLPVIGAGTY